MIEVAFWVLFDDGKIIYAGAVNENMSFVAIGIWVVIWKESVDIPPSTKFD